MAAKKKKRAKKSKKSKASHAKGRIPLRVLEDRIVKLVGVVHKRGDGPDRIHRLVSEGLGKF